MLKLRSAQLLRVKKPNLFNDLKKGVFLPEQGNAFEINIAYYTSKSEIWLVISRVASYFHEPKASANTVYE